MRCNVCGLDLPQDSFYRRSSGKRYSPCINCVKTQRKEFYQRNKRKICLRTALYRDTHWNQMLKRARDWKRRNRDRISVNERVYRMALKCEVFAHYSDNKDIQCKCCGERRLVFLTLDHIDNNGATQRRQLKYRGAGTNFYRWLKNNKYPQAMQVLCWNCNSAKHYEGVCPHQVKYVAAI